MAKKPYSGYARATRSFQNHSGDHVQEGAILDSLSDEQFDELRRFNCVEEVDGADAKKGKAKE